MSRIYLITIYEKDKVIVDKIRVPEDLTEEQFEKLKEDPMVKVKEIFEEEIKEEGKENE